MLSSLIDILQLYPSPVRDLTQPVYNRLEESKSNHSSVGGAGSCLSIRSPCVANTSILQEDEGTIRNGRREQKSNLGSHLTAIMNFPKRSVTEEKNVSGLSLYVVFTKNKR